MNSEFTIVMLLDVHVRAATALASKAAYKVFLVARYYQILQENIRPVLLVDFSQLNKQELPLPRPGPDFSVPVLVGGA